MYCLYLKLRTVFYNKLQYTYNIKDCFLLKMIFMLAVSIPFSNPLKTSEDVTCPYSSYDPTDDFQYKMCSTNSCMPKDYIQKGGFSGCKDWKRRVGG